MSSSPKVMRHPCGPLLAPVPTGVGWGRPSCSPRTAIEVHDLRLRPRHGSTPGQPIPVEVLYQGARIARIGNNVVCVRNPTWR